MPTRTMIKRRPKSRGFTVVEVLVAIVIMALGVLGLAGTATSVSRLIGGGAEQTIAANIAMSRFEQLRGTAWASLAGGTNVIVSLGAALRVKPFPLPRFCDETGLVVALVVVSTT